MPASHDHDDEAFDATDEGDVDVTVEQEDQLAHEQLSYLAEHGFAS